MENIGRLKEATKLMWSLGDYTRVASRLEPYARRLADACQISAGDQVLDVAAGNGGIELANPYVQVLARKET